MTLRDTPSAVEAPRTRAANNFLFWLGAVMIDPYPSQVITEKVQAFLAAIEAEARSKSDSASPSAAEARDLDHYRTHHWCPSFESGTPEATPVLPSPSAVRVLAEAIYGVSQRHDWENNVDREDRTAEILAALPKGWRLTNEAATSVDVAALREALTHYHHGTHPEGESRWHMAERLLAIPAGEAPRADKP